MVENLNILSNIKNELILDNSDKGYYLQIYNKLKKNKKINKEIINDFNNEYIYNFIEVMKNNKKENYLDNLYSNLTVTKIVNKDLIQKEYGKELFGVNIYKNDSIYLYLGDEKELDDESKLTPYHELLHLLTTKFINEDVIALGFALNEFGEGLNEGYTELLTKRYFSNKDNNYYTIYIQHIWFVKMIEEIVGKDKMEDYYFSINQDALLKYLEKYSTDKKVINIVSELDYLFSNDEKVYNIQNDLLEKYDKEKVEELRFLFQENKKIRMDVCNELISIYKLKQKELLDKKEISEIEYINKINTYIKINELKRNEFDNIDSDYLDYFDCEKKQKKWG